MTTRTAGPAQTWAWVAIAALATAAIGGLVLNWYEQLAWYLAWYDETVHVGFEFAATLAAGIWLYRKVLSGPEHQRLAFALTLVLIGLGIGAAWEIAEFTYDHLTGERSVIQGKFDRGLIAA